MNPPIPSSGTLRIIGSPERHDAWARVMTLVMNTVDDREHRDLLLRAVMDYGDACHHDGVELLRSLREVPA